MNGEQVVERARALVGTRFRPQGRMPGVGLDCVGTVVAATGRDPAKVRRDYRLRGGAVADMESELVLAGFVPVARSWARPGDILILSAGGAQLHMAILTERGYVHADAGLGLVVERPGDPPWPVLGVWRADGASGPVVARPPASSRTREGR